MEAAIVYAASRKVGSPERLVRAERVIIPGKAETCSFFSRACRGITSRVTKRKWEAAADGCDW